MGSSRSILTYSDETCVNEPFGGLQLMYYMEKKLEFWQEGQQMIKAILSSFSSDISVISTVEL